jgi:hypothetical protein
MLLKVSPKGELGNRAIVDGTFERVFGKFAERFRPESAYFTAEDGERTALIFFDLKDISDMVAVAEPLWNELHATVHYAPAMNIEEIQKGLKAFTAKH